MKEGRERSSRSNRWIQAVIEAGNNYPIPSTLKETAKALVLLLSDRGEAKHVREWLIKRSPEGLHPFYGATQPIGYTGPLPLPCDYWEGNLYDLALEFAANPEVSTWDMTGKGARAKHADKVANHARLLADALEESVRPEYPPLLALFDDADILGIVEQMPSQFAFISGDNFPRQPPPLAPPLDTPAGRFAFQFPETEGLHRLPTVLRRLADYAERSVNQRSPVARHKTGEPEARVFACKLNAIMNRDYGSHCDRIVADCVTLKYPIADGEKPVTEETIRGWTGRK